MRPRSIAVFCMSEYGHFTLLMPLVEDLAAQGHAVHVFTHVRFAPLVAELGARFVDLFATRTVEDVDATSSPIPARYVTFAAAAADEVASTLRELRVDLVLYETFAVVGLVAARAVGCPYVNVSAGHNINPRRFLEQLRDDPRVAVAPACEHAVRVLRERYGLEDASPFSYVTGISPHLNLYAEPPAYLTEDERRAFGPLAFYGLLRPDAPGGGADYTFPPARLKVYVAFGVTIWRYFAREALAALDVIADAIAGRADAHAVIALPEDGELGARLVRPNVDVVPFVNQLRLLAQASAYVTHHGLASTHEAALHRVPMLSYPFFWDQPALALRCQELGIAAPIAPSVRAPVTVASFDAALELMTARGEALERALDRACAWEHDVIARRPDVLRRLVELVP